MRIIGSFESPAPPLQPHFHWRVDASPLKRQRALLCSIDRSIVQQFNLEMSLKRKAADAAVDAVKKPKSNAAITSFFGQPKPNPSSAKADAPASSPTAPETEPIKFDKDAWVEKLTPEQKQLLSLEINTLHESWLAVLKDEVMSKDFLELKRFLKKEAETGKKIFPPSEDVYSWYVFYHPLHQSINLTMPFQVPPHTPPKRQSRHRRPRPLPQRQPSPRPLLLHPSTNSRPTQLKEHLHRPEERLPRLLTSTKQRRPADPLG